MNCPNCNKILTDNSLLCSNCGYDLREIPWVIICKTYPPNDILIESFLKSCGIPVQLLKESIASVYNFSIGPLGEVKVVVPEMLAEETFRLLKESDLI